jgi:hypothetical protein
MRIDGKWRQCDDGVIRPIIEAEVWAGDASWKPIWLLVDTGADRTVLCADDFVRLGMQATRKGEQLGGVGGVAESAIVSTQIQMLREDGSAVKFRGDFAALLSAEILDISVLGRDIMDQFAVIVDRPGNVVAWIGQRHGYRIAWTP